MVDDASVGHITKSIGVVTERQDAHRVLEASEELGFVKPRLSCAINLPCCAQVPAQAMDEDEAKMRVSFRCGEFPVRPDSLYQILLLS